MDVHVSPTELPELQKFLSAFQVPFRRPEGTVGLEWSTTGRLAELPNKHCETMAQAVPGTSEQRLQEFLTNMHWDAEDLNQQRVLKMVAQATLGEGVSMSDETSFVKPGKASVGMAPKTRGRWARLATVK
jgi:SRSO17 transposase